MENSILTPVESVIGKMYDNPENLGEQEILFKLMRLGYGPNRSKRWKVLEGYSTQLISKEEWITHWCV